MRVPILLCVASCSLLFIGVSSAQFPLERAFPHLTFTNPVDLQMPGDGTHRFFVVELAGVIKVFQNDSAATTSSVFLDIQDRVDDSMGEEGLWGLAFHPDYEHNGYFYVRYSTDSLYSRVSRFKVSASDPNVAEPDSEQILITYQQDASLHFAGQVAFGPNDGYLYIACGDGSGGGDPDCNAQNLASYRGKILRIDVDHPANGRHYGIPPENPFYGNQQGYFEEVYAYGLRQPWRFNIDPVTNWLWVGDVGAATYEEVNVVHSGMNYGWSAMEGDSCYRSPPACAPACDDPSLQHPIWVFDHTIGQAVMGGHVYRGHSVPELIGKYIYADFATATFWSIVYDGINPAINTQIDQQTLSPVAFGNDEYNELYVCVLQPEGSIYRFTPTVTQVPDQVSLLSPANGTTVMNDSVTLVWQGAGVTADRYWVEYAADSLFTGSTIDSTVIDTTAIVSQLQNQMYWWRVRGHSYVGWGPYSDAWNFSAITTGVGGAGRQVPHEFSLSQNYPNPFNPSTTIKYALPVKSSVRLEVFNSLGQLVATIVNQEQEAGFHQVVFEKRDIASGVYLFRLSAGSFVETKKLVLIR